MAYRHLLLEHQRQLHGTNPLERVNKESKRRSNIVVIAESMKQLTGHCPATALEIFTNRA